jgi:hypothetical protein
VAKRKDKKGKRKKGKKKTNKSMLETSFLSFFPPVLGKISLSITFSIFLNIKKKLGFLFPIW